MPQGVAHGACLVIPLRGLPRDAPPRPHSTAISSNATWLGGLQAPELVQARRWKT